MLTNLLDFVVLRTLEKQKLVSLKREPALPTQDLHHPDREAQDWSGLLRPVGLPACLWERQSREARGRSEAGRLGRPPAHPAQDWPRLGRHHPGQASARIWAGSSCEARGAGGAEPGLGLGWGLS